ncbi:ABC transporter substrate-binding protein [Nannocystis sp.]|uniref:ABC transporter substrate-binding protein n=1 Tax=Nannocystis sp. TaxID=1962667 RepID=UPI0025E5A4F7|nr:ABC transporter substrate-binding protein [Nannocystis sp.]MBK7826875.1 ABC transporter substrate-binding protein [Nannocystis sp.]
MLSRRRMSAALLAALVAGPVVGPVLGACGGASGEPVLRLGYFPNITHAAALVGVQDGTFARELGATKLETFTFNAGPAAIEALLSGSLDASYIGPNPAINAFVRSRGEAVRIVAGATSGGAFLVVRPDITSPADLRGQQLASPQLGGTQDVALRTWLASQGLATDTAGGGDVSVVPQENAQTLERFRDGKLAGAWVPEPWASRLVLEGGGKVLVDERDLWPGKQYTTTVLLVRSEFLQQHPERALALLRGHLAATKWLQDNPGPARTQVNAAIEQLTGKPIGQAVIDRAFPSLGFTTDPHMASLAKCAADAEALGLLKLEGLDLSRLYDPTLLHKLQP